MVKYFKLKMKNGSTMYYSEKDMSLSDFHSESNMGVWLTSNVESYKEITHSEWVDRKDQL